MNCSMSIKNSSIRKNDSVKIVELPEIVFELTDDGKLIKNLWKTTIFNFCKLLKEVSSKLDVMLSQHLCEACGQLLPELKDIPSSSTTN